MAASPTNACTLPQQPNLPMQKRPKHLPHSSSYSSIAQPDDHPSPPPSRAGLTPKFRDTETLCESLTYATGLPDVLKGERIHDHVKVSGPFWRGCNGGTGGLA